MQITRAYEDHTRKRTGRGHKSKSQRGPLARLHAFLRVALSAPLKYTQERRDAPVSQYKSRTIEPKLTNI